MKNLLCFFIFCSSAVFSQTVDSTGIKLLEQKRFTEAESFFKAAVKKDKKDAESHYFLSISLMMKKNYDDAQDAVEEAIDLNENVAKYHLMRGQILGQKAMTANVISQGFLAPKIKNAFLRASELDPSNVEARLALFNYYVMAPGIMGGSDEKALEQAHAVEKLDPIRGHLMLASYSNRKKDFKKAEAEYVEAIKVDPKKGTSYKSLGYFYMNQKRYDEALAKMKSYIELEPHNADSYDSYADVLKEQEKFDPAIEKYLFALSIEKDFAPSIYSLAECYEKKGLKSKAKETYQWLVSIEPEGRRADNARKKINEL
jgi:tetratricopeptide (TPR) repeat protein